MLNFEIGGLILGIVILGIAIIALVRTQRPSMIIQEKITDDEIIYID